MASAGGTTVGGNERAVKQSRAPLCCLKSCYRLRFLRRVTGLQRGPDSSTRGCSEALPRGMGKAKGRFMADSLHSFPKMPALARGHFSPTCCPWVTDAFKDFSCPSSAGRNTMPDAPNEAAVSHPCDTALLLLFFPVALCSQSKEVAPNTNILQSDRGREEASVRQRPAFRNALPGRCSVPAPPPVTPGPSPPRGKSSPSFSFFSPGPRYPSRGFPGGWAVSPGRFILLIFCILRGWFYSDAFITCFQRLEHPIKHFALSRGFTVLYAKGSAVISVHVPAAEPTFPAAPVQAFLSDAEFRITPEGGSGGRCCSCSPRPRLTCLHLLEACQRAVKHRRFGWISWWNRRIVPIAKCTGTRGKRSARKRG
ncbi:uncharacterized protein LOC112973693 isoform X1 [Apteryx rowi]|uniref:uncharacterized protein LOC112973693 isoform X1 n=1 Tax=Apteryx rowi TaxID=308060 RepID=UPI000E1CA9CB|nr:uncharacterized protein LOC112973693 isoform X1 [Apteryx rowi]XP_025937651.1 uncharacterized protein LOC112973693 isoform X1 [Apteryx rowi]XP_025937652.1 uncharacterized protein LOC112973693 isoform X1 [Apteryx rowi]XP_025937654.1 uncharacterized protein LOC112973693 isoform X1 [Apteryx rowi]XP_025937655.1 uncharacterized protein LOC112973693 isoform X1 [Apteryx rowi]XP_025937656.1 uncharacterized protein LOC112973693 isoform X1 [Apteryx rowi]XP_025937657.1 uncharacterized protein LOC11297